MRALPTDKGERGALFRKEIDRLGLRPGAVAALCCVSDRTVRYWTSETKEIPTAAFRILEMFEALSGVIKMNPVGDGSWARLMAKVRRAVT